MEVGCSYDAVLLHLFMSDLFIARMALTDSTLTRFIKGDIACVG